MTSFFKDIVRTGSFNPPNPILQSLDFPKVTGNSQPSLVSPLYQLPKFSAVLPYHLETAAKHVLQTFKVELAELERKLVTSEEEPSLSFSFLLMEMDRLQSPITQIREVCILYTTLAANPDQIQAWKDAVASPSVKMIMAMTGDSSPLYQSHIVYQGLVTAHHKIQGHDPISSSSFFMPFHKQGMHLVNRTSSTPNDKAPEQFQQIHGDLQVILERLHSVISYDQASKAVRLQCVSDMYQCLGLTRMQADILGFTSVREMSQRQYHHMMMPTRKSDWNELCKELSLFLQPFVPNRTKLNLEDAGAFLDGPNNSDNVVTKTPDQQMSVLKAKYLFKQCMRLQGVLQGLIDFCDAILGLRVVEDTLSQKEGWNKNVRLLHVYENDDDVNVNTAKENSNYLGAIYFDPYADAYWRTAKAEELVMTRLYGHNPPVVVMALKIRPTWDGAPAPVGWDDTRDLLFHFGMALQMILGQASKRSNIALPQAPIDTTEMLGHVSSAFHIKCHF
jgi:hypothetical protein